MPQQRARKEPNASKNQNNRPQKVPVQSYPISYRKQKSEAYAEDYDTQDQGSRRSASSAITVIVAFIPPVSPVTPFLSAYTVEKGAAVDAHGGVVFVFSVAFCAVNQINLFLNPSFCRVCS
jgi:hypothetical protein